MFGGDWHPVFDPTVVETVVDLTPAVVAHLLVFLTYLGSVFVVVPLVVAAYWWDPKRFAHWIPTVVGYYAVMGSIKSLNSATRPEAGPPVSPDAAPAALAGTYEHAATISTTSFPSGNVIAATVLAGLFVLDARIWTFRRRLLAGAILVGLVSYTRIGLGVHYPIDVIGGIAIAVGYLGVVELVRQRTRNGTAILFVLAAVLAVVAVWLRTGLGDPPTAEGLAGSNRPVALGAAIGGLAVWLALQDRPQPTGRQTAFAAGFGLVAVATGAMLAGGIVTHPFWAVGLAAVAFGAAVAMPWAVPGHRFLTPESGTDRNESGSLD